MMYCERVCKDRKKGDRVVIVVEVVKLKKVGKEVEF